MRAFKWAYDSEKDDLIVWSVNGPEAWATPQHGEALTNTQYATFYQGRIVLGPNGVESFTFYDDRPFTGRTAEGVTKARLAIIDWLLVDALGSEVTDALRSAAVERLKKMGIV